MTLTKVGKLQRRLDKLLNGGNDIDANKLLLDLIEYRQEELARSFNGSGVQVEEEHQRLSNRLDTMINTLRTSEEGILKKRLP